MNQNRKSLSLLWLMNLAFTLGVAFGCESLKQWLRERNLYFAVSGDMLMWSAVVLTFITGAVVVWLMWAFLRTTSIPKWIAGIYLIVALFIISRPFYWQKIFR
jgi:hypothetical protein